MRQTIGVIVPAYNAEPVVDRSLASIAAQSRPPDVVVLVDDASTDRTAERGLGWRGFLPLTVLCRDENGGPGAARADGIASIDTDLIALCDADDHWLPDHLEVLAELHEKHGGLIAASHLDWAPGAAIAEHPLRVPVERRQFKAMLRRNLIISATLFSRELYESAGGFRALRQSEDWDLWIRMLHAGARITPADHPTVLRPPSSAGRDIDAILRAHVEVLERFAAENPEPKTRRLVERAIRHHHARIALAGSFEAAAEGRFGHARRHARGGLLGGLSQKVRGAVMMVTPRRGLAFKRRRGDDRRPGIVDLRDRAVDADQRRERDRR